MLNDEIKTFKAVMKYGNISRAAEHLYISQPTLSLRIRDLEERVGCKLFLRRKGVRTIELTAEGKQFVVLCDMWENLMQDMQDLQAKARCMPFRVSSLNSISTAIMPEVYVDFLRVQQDTSLETEDLSSYASYDAVESRLIDFAIVVDHRYSLKAVRNPLFTEKMKLVCNVNSKLPPVAEISDLNPNNDIYSPWFLEYEQWYRCLFGKAACPRMQIQTMQLMEFFLEQPENWSIVPATMEQKLLKNPNITSRALNADIPERNISYLIPDESEHPHLDFFLKCLQQQLKQAESEGILRCLF